ncbi:DUF6625 family protein [Gaetbulibacter saemankumensis]|uniref:DUF6625 family protein n=1 Tax=Gaetbulibacter saemankumensis TaxID=311208 RepID=UPI000415D5C5|nr:DUF6625 family protein [Gaetbulibacter saemankumensis]
MKKIILIVPYFGSWPVWFDAFLVSVAKNPSVHWFCPTDCEIPQAKPDNITFLQTSLRDLNTTINNKLDFKVSLNIRKFCDLKPAYGDIFGKVITGYDFWGICDMDIIWGDIRSFMTDEVLSSYDIISSRKGAISGHFTLFRNVEPINMIYREIADYKELMGTSKLTRFDETVLTYYIRHSIGFKVGDLKIKWDAILCNQERGRDSHQEYYLDRWQWREGRIINTKTNKEFMYLHFINWKRTMRYNKVKYSEPLPNQFYISYNGMHFERHSMFAHVLNTIKNVFNGYYVRIKIKLYVRKFNRFSHKLIVKFKRN